MESAFGEMERGGWHQWCHGLRTQKLDLEEHAGKLQIDVGDGHL
jgi:hypothetical protein